MMAVKNSLWLRLLLSSVPCPFVVIVVPEGDEDKIGKK
jgi:hypothetical protein